jgi:hypothetical protein
MKREKGIKKALHVDMEDPAATISNNGGITDGETVPGTRWQRWIAPQGWV